MRDSVIETSFVSIRDSRVSFLARYRAGAACGLAEMEKICIGNPRKMTHAERLKLEEAYVCYRAAANTLASYSLLHRLTRWRTRPKGHALEHCVFDFHENPRHSSNYLGEDFVRRTKRTALVAHPKWVSQQVLLRYSIAACLKWAGLISE